MATDVGGVRAGLGDGAEALLVPPNDPEALAAAITRVASDGDLRAVFRELGFARDRIRRVYGIDQFPLIPNGIPVDTFRHPSIDRERWRNKVGFAPTDVLFVCVAWLRPQKNPALLLEAFRRGPASDPRAHPLLVGTGALRSELARQIGALGLQERVHLLGLRSDVPENYIGRGLYYNQLRRYFGTFPRGQVRIYLYEDLSGAPISTVQCRQDILAGEVALASLQGLRRSQDSKPC